MKNPYLVHERSGNSTSVNANTDIMSTDFSPKFDGYLHVQHTAVTSGTFKIIKKATSGGSAEATLILNSATAQVAAATYNYTVLLRKGKYYNFQIGTGSVITELLAFFCSEGRGS